MMFKMIIDIFSQNDNSGLFRGCWNPAPTRGRSKSEGGLLDKYHNMILTHILTMLTILIILMIRTSLATPPSTWPPALTMFLSSPSCSGGASRRISHIMIIMISHIMIYHDEEEMLKVISLQSGHGLDDVGQQRANPASARSGRSFLLCFGLLEWWPWECLIGNGMFRTNAWRHYHYHDLMRMISFYVRRNWKSCKRKRVERGEKRWPKLKQRWRSWSYWSDISCNYVMSWSTNYVFMFFARIMFYQVGAVLDMMREYLAR